MPTKKRFTVTDWVLITLLALLSALFVRQMFISDTIEVLHQHGGAYCFSKFSFIAICFDDGLPPRVTKEPIFQHWSNHLDPRYEIDWWHMTSDGSSGFFSNPITHDFGLWGFRLTTISGAKFGRSWWGVWFQIPDWFIMTFLAIRPGRKLCCRLRSSRQGGAFPVEPSKASKQSGISE